MTRNGVLTLFAPFNMRFPCRRHIDGSLEMRLRTPMPIRTIYARCKMMALSQRKCRSRRSSEARSWRSRSLMASAMLPLEVKPLAFPPNQFGNKNALIRPKALSGNRKLGQYRSESSRRGEAYMARSINSHSCHAWRFDSLY